MSLSISIDNWQAPGVRARGCTAAGRGNPESALEDQQLAGLLMWVPMGIVYLAACLVLASRLVVEVTSPGEARPVESVSAEEIRW
jgi:hypothetical protein